ncbi:CDP-alcohol phosphatidyltransferase family protein [Chryseolinea soli]|uniref:CDP-alcohol phosphatidyltransferase family protein n=1 Tax=Chryseolinea soli TaxID=2321403 RepID=A0A385SK04_9BACT|nr:CDP-alcohol phosphatidyltransferase family protein [Chryseolinea soli]AYB29338.1 CDP-alcohol phosphatidyltransferase family protein [Chryseolinea soli]
MNIPQSLILFRFLCAPVILGAAYFVGEEAKPLILVLMYLGLISDILDGIVARKTNVSSAALRRLDSQTDMIFWLSIGFATWMLYPQLIRDNALAIYTILAMEVAVYAISLLKFKRETCTHAFLSKLWGITLLIAFTSLIGFNHAGIPFFAAITMGLISHVDRILITLILPEWTHDIPSTYHAYLIRKGVKFKRNEYLNG